MTVELEVPVHVNTRESEAMLASNRPAWSVGERVRVYRARHGIGRIVADAGEAGEGDDPRDYDVEWYVRLLRETFAARMVRAGSMSSWLANRNSAWPSY